ncbi:MAG: RAMP superfamily CRISPR-associated protein [Candidatus Caldarchaeum sp.]
MPNLHVVRDKPRDRHTVTNLSGVLDITVKTLSYLHVGSGAEQVKIAQNIESIARDINKLGLKKLAQSRWSDIIGEGEFMAMPAVAGVPVIPGSSVKGNIRARMELSFVPRNGSVRSCFSVNMRQATKSSWRHSRIWGKRVEANRGRACTYNEEEPAICLLCDIFGTQGLASLVMFSDFVGNRVALERISGEYGMKLLAAPPGSSFHGEISFRNLAESELGLILFGGMGISNSNAGRPVLLGRLKYRGKLAGKEFGRIQYVINSLTLSRLSKPLLGLGAGEQASGNMLQNVINTLISSAEREYGGELETVDEVKALA